VMQLPKPYGGTVNRYTVAYAGGYRTNEIYSSRKMYIIPRSCATHALGMLDLVLIAGHQIAPSYTDFVKLPKTLSLYKKKVKS
jgi:hypothetical protein